MIERERKYIVDPIVLYSNPYMKQLRADYKYDIIEQTYLDDQADIRVRRIVSPVSEDATQWLFCAKTPTGEIGVRNEWEHPISRERYDQYVSARCGSTIRKQRYRYLPETAITQAITYDVYGVRLRVPQHISVLFSPYRQYDNLRFDVELIVAEVEFAEDDIPIIPPGAVFDVTGIPKFSNRALAQIQTNYVEL